MKGQTVRLLICSIFAYKQLFSFISKLTEITNNLKK